MAASKVNQNIRKALMFELDAKMQQVEGVIMQTLHYVGLKAVTHARKNVTQATSKEQPPHKPTYTVRTGNLVSSIGYTIVKDGKIMTVSDFQPISGIKGNGKQGANKGKSFAESKAGSTEKGMSLIVVAGMPYAEYLEAKGYDVLNSAQLKAEAEAKQKMQKIINHMK